MRLPLSRHDGVVSAMRVHDGKFLLAAAQDGAPQFRSELAPHRLWGMPIPRIFQAITGIRRGAIE
jgi:hypothetical protein